MLAWAGLAACRKTTATTPPDAAVTSADARAASPRDASADANTSADAKAASAGSAAPDATAGPAEREIGPYEIPLRGTRKVYYVVPRSTKAPARLVANLHGVCNPPGYACGYWIDAASKVGFLVCPEGDGRCGPSGPPTWTEPATRIDEDLERAIAAVEARHPGEIDREGAVLTGFSLGAYAAVQIARAHPGRWPYLVLTEADVPLDLASLRAAGVRAVALVAGERGSQVAGARRTAERLAQQGFPARLWVMKGAGHHYSADVDDIMAEAMAFVIGEGDAGAGR